MHWSADYVGLPYLDDGYSRAGVSCWGLVWLVQREVFGRALHRHDQAQSTNFEIVDFGKENEGDVLHMWGIQDGKRLPMHVGVITEPGHVLHIEGETGSIVENYRSLRAAWRPIKVCRIV